jgi:hypothetical protein
VNDDAFREYRQAGQVIALALGIGLRLLQLAAFLTSSAIRLSPAAVRLVRA